MFNALLKGTLLGGLVLFVWSSLAWTVLHLHDSALLRFTSEDAVTQAIVANAPQSGIYVAPAAANHTPGMSPDQIKAADQAAQDRMAKGPAVFASVRLGAMGSMAPYMIVQVITCLLAALLATLLLLKA